MTPPSPLLPPAPARLGSNLAALNLPLILSLALAVAGCTAGAGAEQVKLTGFCPDPVVVQTDWFPGPEWGALYQLMGKDMTVKDEVASGPLGETGVSIQVRAGGPALGGEAVTERMYEDSSILLGAVPTGRALRDSADLATVAVVSPLDASPRVLLWDPAKVPAKDVTALGALGDRARVVYAEGADDLDVLASKGLLRREQLDPSSDGSATQFTTEEGIVQHALVSGDPYTYEHELAERKGPVRFELVDRAGYRPYPALVVRAGTVAEEADCLARLVPMIQKAQVDYLADPGPVNARMPELSRPFADFRPVSPAAADDAVKRMVELNVASNGPNATVGDFDEARVAQVIADALPAIEEADPEAGLAAVKPHIGPADLVTNRFIDPEIGIGQP